MTTRPDFTPAAGLAPPPEVRLIRSDAEAIAVAKDLAASFAPGSAARDRDRILPWAELHHYSASGLWGITVPRRFGGPGVSAATLAQVIAILSAADGSLGHVPQNHFYALEILRSGASEAQQAHFNALALKGWRFGNAVSEIGTRDFSRKTALTEDEGRLFVTGRKFYCTGAIYAHIIPTAVLRPDGEQVMIYIPRETPGITITDDWDGIGQRLTGSGSVAFDRVEVQPDWIVPFQTSFERPTTIGPHAQIIHAAIDLGIAQGAFAQMLALTRENAGSAQADDPLTGVAVGELAAQLGAAEALLLRAGLILDKAMDHATEDSVAEASVAVAAAKVLSTEASLLASNRLIELGATTAGLRRESLDLPWRNARTHTLHDPVRWKFHAIGNHVLNGTLPPRHGAI